MPLAMRHGVFNFAEEQANHLRIPHLSIAVPLRPDISVMQRRYARYRAAQVSSARLELHGALECCHRSL